MAFRPVRDESFGTIPERDIGRQWSDRPTLSIVDRMEVRLDAPEPAHAGPRFEFDRPPARHRAWGGAAIRHNRGSLLGDGRSEDRWEVEWSVLAAPRNPVRDQL